jgi:DNA polymerase elongation subunit (family B)
LLIGFRDLVREWSPQIVVGYNVIGFDRKYLTASAEKHRRCLTKFMPP